MNPNINKIFNENIDIFKRLCPDISKGRLINYLNIPPRLLSERNDPNDIYKTFVYNFYIVENICNKYNQSIDKSDNKLREIINEAINYANIAYSAPPPSSLTNISKLNTVFDITTRSLPERDLLSNIGRKRLIPGVVIRDEKID